MLLILYLNLFSIPGNLFFFQFIFIVLFQFSDYSCYTDSSKLYFMIILCKKIY